MSIELILSQQYVGESMDFLKKLHNKVTAPDSNINLQLNSWNIALGDKLNGSLTLSAKEDFESTEVRCEIDCVETANVIRNEYDPTLKRYVPREVTESKIIFASKPTLNGPTHFTNGETRSFPISISLSAAARMSYQGVDRRVVWTIKGIVAVDGRPDVTTHSCEFQVVQAPQAVAGQQVVVKEVVHEIVKIPCRYCQTLFDQLETSCPNCGAKRTA
jgi:hypothetical protein